MLLLKGNNTLTYICSHHAVILTLLYVSLQLHTVRSVFVYDYHVNGTEASLCNKY